MTIVQPVKIGVEEHGTYEEMKKLDPNQPFYLTDIFNILNDKIKDEK